MASLLMVAGTVGGWVVTGRRQRRSGSRFVLPAWPSLRAGPREASTHAPSAATALMASAVVSPGASPAAGPGLGLVAGLPGTSCSPSISDVRYWTVPGTVDGLTQYWMSHPVPGLSVGLPGFGNIRGAGPYRIVSEWRNGAHHSVDFVTYRYAGVQGGRVAVRVDAIVVPHGADCRGRP